MSESPELPHITELTTTQAHRLITADWLEAVARLIRMGNIVGFDIAWNEKIQKPVGKYMASADALIGPVENMFYGQIAQIKAQQAQVIPVVDVTEQLKDHPPCEGEDKENCALCNSKLS